MGQHHPSVAVEPRLVCMDVLRQRDTFSKINTLTYDEFKEKLQILNELSRKLVDPDGKQMVFVANPCTKHDVNTVSGSDTCWLWKATVRIACVKVDPLTRKIDSYKMLTLKQFLCVFRTFQEHLGIVMGSDEEVEYDEEDRELERYVAKFGLVPAKVERPKEVGPVKMCEHLDHIEECSICLDRRTNMLLPCMHAFCVSCIQKWNVKKKNCPICSAELPSTDESWVMSEIPSAEEITDEMRSLFMNLVDENKESKDKKEDENKDEKEGKYDSPAES